MAGILRLCNPIRFANQMAALCMTGPRIRIMEMWMVSLEVVAQTREGSSPKIGFMNVTTWVDSKEAAEAGIEKYLRSLDWHLVSGERSHIVNQDGEGGEMEWDQIERAGYSPDAIILGTIHTYKTI